MNGSRTMTESPKLRQILLTPTPDVVIQGNTTAVPTAEGGLFCRFIFLVLLGEELGLMVTLFFTSQRIMF